MPDSNGTYIPTLQFQPYVSPYTQAPVKEFDDFGKLLNERYDTNIAQYDKLNEVMNQLQVSDADQHIKQGLLTDTRAAIDNIVKNGDWENARSPVRQIANRFTTDPIISKALTNYQKAQKLQDEARQAEMNGKPQIQFKDISNFSTVDPNTGKIRDLDTSGVYQDRLDYEGKMNQLFEGLHANSTGNKTNNMVRDPDTGQLYQAGSGYTSSGISKQQVIDTANRQFGSYLASSEGQQRLQVLTSKNSDNNHPVDTASAINIMKQELINAGLNKVFHESTSESFTKPDRFNKSTNPQVNGTLINDISYQKNQDFGDLIESLDKKERYGIEKETLGTRLGPVDRQKAGLKLGYGEVPKNMTDTYNNLYNIFSNSLDTKDKDKINPQIKKYLVSIRDGKIQPNLLAYNDTKDIDAANNFFRNGAYQSAEYLDPQTGKKLSWEKITDKYKNEKGNKLSDSGADNDIEKAKVTGEYSPDNPFYDMTAKDPNFANAKKVIIGGHSFVMGASVQDKTTADYEAKHLTAELTSARRTGLSVKLSHDVMVVPGPNNEGYLIKQGNGQFRGKSDGTALSLEEIFALTYGNGVTPTK